MRVLVAGASGGIGEGVCRELLRRGHEVVAVGRDHGRLAVLADRLPHAGDRLKLVVADVTAADDASRRLLEESAPDLDGVFLAIGTPGRSAGGSVLTIAAEDAREMVEVNELGGLRALQNLVPLLPPHGAVVNVVGYSAEVAFPGNPLMGSTNAAMRSLLLTLAEQLRGSGPRVYALVVGVVRTRARQAAGVDDPSWLTGDEVGAYAADLIQGDVPRPELALRYLLDAAQGPQLSAPGRG